MTSTLFFLPLTTISTSQGVTSASDAFSPAVCMEVDSESIPFKHTLGFVKHKTAAFLNASALRTTLVASRRRRYPSKQGEERGRQTSTLVSTLRLSIVCYSPA